MRKYKVGQEIEMYSFVTNAWHESVVLEFVDDKMGIRTPDGTYEEGLVYLCDTSFKGDPKVKSGHTVEKFMRPRNPKNGKGSFNEMIKKLKQTDKKTVEVK